MAVCLTQGSSCALCTYPQETANVLTSSVPDSKPRLLSVSVSVVCKLSTLATRWYRLEECKRVQRSLYYRLTDRPIDQPTHRPQGDFYICLAGVKVYFEFYSLKKIFVKRCTYSLTPFCAFPITYSYK